MKTKQTQNWGSGGTDEMEVRKGETKGGGIKKKQVCNTNFYKMMRLGNFLKILLKILNTD